MAEEARANVERWPLWSPVAAGLGAALYFGLRVEPPMALALGLAGLSLALAVGAGRGLRLRRRGQPPAVLALADRALRRLTLRQRRMLHQGKHPNLVTVAIARELVGFIWNALQATVPARA